MAKTKRYNAIDRLFIRKYRLEMKYLLYYKLDNNFIDDQVEAGGDGTNVVSVVDGVAWSNDVEKIHFNPHDEPILTYSVTVKYQSSNGITVAPSETIKVDCISGKTTEIVVTPKSVNGYINEEYKKTVTITGNTEVIFRYYGPDHFNPLTFNIETAGYIRWTLNNTSLSFLQTIEYRKNNSTSWTSIRSRAGDSAPSIYVNAGDKVEFRGDNTGYTNPSNSQCYNSFSGTTCKFSLAGNIMSLINSTGFSGVTTLTSDYAFQGLFSNCTGLTSAENLILPLTTLKHGCYTSMFSSCILLTTPPGLPATELVEYCYGGMFAGCTSLTTTPELPATTLADGCYMNMFSGCTSLTQAPVLPATTLTEDCYHCMFYNCISLTTPPVLPAITLAESCYEFMFAGCTSLTTPPELPSTSVAYECYYGMFYGCTSLTTAPVLPARRLAGYCYMNMFEQCTNLAVPPELPATVLAVCCYTNMFAGCTTLTTAPELLVDSVTVDAYRGMFENCTSLNYIKCLAVSGYENLSSWVKNVAQNGTFIKNTNASAWTIGDNGIPTGWVVENYGFGLSKKLITFDGVSSAKTVTITSLFNNWTATTNDNWYGLSQYAGGTGDTIITITANTEDTFRTGMVTFTDGMNVAELNVINEKHFVGTPLTFNIISSGTIYWRTSNSSYAKTIQYKKNDGYWTNITANTGNLAPSISVSAGDVIQFIGDNATYGNSSIYNSFSGSTAKFEVEGNIMSLIDGTGFTTATIMTEPYVFYGLFSNCTGLTSTENLILPATTLTNYCYMNMFSGCTSMGLTPFILPATALAMHCYQNMFIYCNNITQTPILPATTLTTECYRSMFNRCTSLVTPPVLPATSLGAGCYQNMFWGCSGLTTAPVLPATVLIDSCYESMFDGCTSLATAPDLDASILVTRCYYYMFNNCSSLSYIKCTATNPTIGDAYTKQWVKGVSSTGTFVKNASASINNWGWGQEGIPNGWTVEDAS